MTRWKFGYKPALMDTIECINKQYSTQSMGEIEDFLGCMYKHDLTKITLKIYKPGIINKMTQGLT